MPSGGDIVSIVAGLAVGIAFIIMFSILFQFTKIPDNSGEISIVTVPENASMSYDMRFEPKVIIVEIGRNNTVRWINNDSILHSVYADDDNDPLFYEATKEECENNDYQNCHVILTKNILIPGQTFEFTFAKPGVFGYHSVPHPQMKGTVVVYPHNWKITGYIPKEPVVYEGQAIESVEKYLSQRVNNFAGIKLYSNSPAIPSNHSRYLNVTEFFNLGGELSLRYYPTGSSGSFYSIDPREHAITGKCVNAACLPFNDEYVARLRGKLVYLVDSAWLYRNSSGQLVDLPDGFFVDAYTGDVVATSFRCPDEKQEWCK